MDEDTVDKLDRAASKYTKTKKGTEENREAAEEYVHAINARLERIESIIGPVQILGEGMTWGRLAEIHKPYFEEREKLREIRTQIRADVDESL